VAFWLSRGLLLTVHKLIAEALKELPGLACVDIIIYSPAHWIIVDRPTFLPGTKDPIGIAAILDRGLVATVDADELLAELGIDPDAADSAVSADTAARPRRRTPGLGTKRRSARPAVPLAKRMLHAPPERCEKLLGNLMRALPNDLPEQGARNDWIGKGQALWGACGGADWGLPIYLEWCARWPCGEDDPAANEVAWASFDERGVNGVKYLCGWAHEVGTPAALAAVKAIELASFSMIHDDDLDDDDADGDDATGDDEAETETAETEANGAEKPEEKDGEDEAAEMQEEEKKEKLGTKQRAKPGAKKSAKNGAGKGGGGSRTLTPDEALPAGVTIADFHAYKPQKQKYIFHDTGDLWPAESVNASVAPITLRNANGQAQRSEGVNGKQGRIKRIAASAWLDRHQHVEQLTWAPGYPQVIADRLVSEGGWIDRQGCAVFNLYRPPIVAAGDAGLAGRWVDHVRLVYPDDADHIIAWLAHRVQRPEEKINHGLVLSGDQGIGKDTILEPVKYAVGPWNFIEASPQEMLERFNGHVKSVILRISEARDLGEVNRFAFYDHMKVVMAAPPDVLRVDEKNIRKYSVLNVCGVILTTNHQTTGLHLPPDDRRHYVAASTLTPEYFETRKTYWSDVYGWYDQGGDRHVAAFLREYDISGFDAKAPPKKTQAFWDIVDASRAPEDNSLADVIDEMGAPKAVTLDEIVTRTAFDRGQRDVSQLHEWLIDRKNSRQVPHRMKTAGYSPVRNSTAKDGCWKIGDKRRVIYVKSELSLRDRGIAAKDFFEKAMAEARKEKKTAENGAKTADEAA
jgi:hypothetical protein